MDGDKKHPRHPVVPSDQAPHSSTCSPRSPSICKESPCFMLTDLTAWVMFLHLQVFVTHCCLEAEMFLLEIMSFVCICQLTEAKPLAEAGRQQCFLRCEKDQYKILLAVLCFTFLFGIFLLVSQRNVIFPSQPFETPHGWISAGSIQSQSMLCVLINETSTAEPYYAGTSKQAIRKQLGETLLKPQAGTGGSYEWETQQSNAGASGWQYPLLKGFELQERCFKSISLIFNTTEAIWIKELCNVETNFVTASSLILWDFCKKSFKNSFWRPSVPWNPQAKGFIERLK